MLTCPHCKTGRVFMDGHRNECTCLQCGWTPTRAITDEDRKAVPRWGKTADIGRRPKRKGIGSLIR